MGRVAGALGCAVAALAGGCEQPRTELVVRVDSRLPWGPGRAVQSVVLEVRREGPSGPLRSLRTTVVGDAVEQRTLPFTVGVLPADGTDAPVWLRLLGCASPLGCSATDAVARAEVSERFVPDQTLDVALVLGATDARIDAGADVGELHDAMAANDLAEAGADVASVVDAATPDAVDVPATLDAGPVDAGGFDLGPLDAATADLGPTDVATPDLGFDAGTPEAGTVDAGMDLGAFDLGAPDAGPPDTGAACAGPTCPCSPTAPAGWCAIGAACMGGTCVVGPTAGSLVITEIMNDSMAVGDLSGEWFEVYNRVETPVDLRGLRVRGNGTEMFEVTGANPVVVAGRGYAVLGASGDTAINGGVVMTYVYGSGAMNLSNTSDVITLVAADGSTIDAVAYPASGWSETAGRS
ncbi:MAG: lamin tail domain-containing protein, partial [Deltaproteobacteria bacterium]|nr:lamin tail domain-containing protein [Deltaproteobacteria bacterium]